MADIFLKIVNMSISASWIVLAVLLLRLILKKAPKWTAVLLWGIVAVRLICPFSVESVMSLIPSAETISPEIMMDKMPQINTGIPVLNNTVNPVIGNSLSPDPAASANPLQIWISVLSIIWVAGIVLMLAYTAISYWRVRRKIGTAVLLRDNVYQCETVVSPFVLGIIKPKIYMPFHISEQDTVHVIAHEQAHICRKDHWWKPFGFLLLTLHWFNPLMWLGYILLCRDIELACDEKVVKEMNTEQRADYSQALLTCSVNRRMIAACPLAFGEVGVKGRVRSVLNYRKPAFWIIIAAIIASIVAAVCFLTDPASDRLDSASDRLKNIENLSLNSITEETVAVFTGDGASFHRIGAVSKDLLQDLSDIKISQKEISQNRDEGRDKSHTLVLQNAKDVEPTYSSNLPGLHIHFDSDFTSVWVNNGANPTFSYKVIDPKKAREVYNYIAGYNVREPAVGVVDDSSNVLYSGDIALLKAKYPSYFDLDTTKGLDLYIWQMAADSYSCGLLSGKNNGYTQEELWELGKSSASIGEMRAIIAHYISIGKITKDRVTIQAIRMPYSSYLYNIDDSYCQKLNELFWSELPIVVSSPYRPIIDTAIFDIDGDGKEEQCTLSYGPTSGLFTIILSAYEDGVLKYYNIFDTRFLKLSFEKDAEGQTILLGKDGDDTLYLYMHVENGNIVITCDGLDILYWGEQGINSPFAPETEMSRLNAVIPSVLEEKYRSEDDGFIHIQSFHRLAYMNENEASVATKHTVYLIVYHALYKADETLEEAEGGFVPTAITFSEDGNGDYTLEDYWTPRAGTNYESDILEKFPEGAAYNALNFEKYAEVLKNDSLNQALKYFNDLNNN